MTGDENADRSLLDFAKQVFRRHQNTPEVGFNFMEPEPAEKKTAPTPAAIEKIADVEEGDPAGAKNAEDTSTVSEKRLIAGAAVQEAQPSVPKAAGASKDGRQFRTATEMAHIILNALRAVDGAPERGFVVTVYGANPWNAMLTIKPEAGPIKDAQLWRGRVQDIGARLRQDFDVIHEQ